MFVAIALFCQYTSIVLIIPIKKTRIANLVKYSNPSSAVNSWSGYPWWVEKVGISRFIVILDFLYPGSLLL